MGGKYGSNPVAVETGKMGRRELFAEMQKQLLHLNEWGELYSLAFQPEPPSVTPTTDGVCGDGHLMREKCVLPRTSFELKYSVDWPNASFNKDGWELKNSRAEWLIVGTPSGWWVTTMKCAREVWEYDPKETCILIKRSKCPVVLTLEEWLKLVCP